ncbi:MAG: AgmX/PglI C-terminal domain-containing protein [Kofleriaceae bacterium]
MAAPRPPQQHGNGNANGNANGPPRPRILRIGILLGGKIVEERLIRERISVSIGQSMKNTFSIPVEGLPLEFPLFHLEHDRYSLRFLAKMDGRLSDGGNVFTLDQLKSSGARKVGDYWEVALTPTARGKLSLGDLTVLFQFVTEPPRQPKPMLPASVRGTFADRFDPRLSVIMGASIIIHFAVVIIALTMDRPKSSGMADRAYNMVFTQDQYTVDVTKPEPQKAADTGSAAAKTPDKVAAKSAEKPKTPAVDPNAGRDAAKDIAMQEEQAKAMADLLTGEGANGTSEGDMSKRRPGADLGQQIADVREGGKTVAVGGGAGRGPRGDGDARVGNGKGPNINAPGGTETAGGPKVEHAPTGRIQVSDKQTFDESSLTPDVVLSKIQSVYMGQIKRCYTTFLKKDATARGKVTLKLTVNETGRAVQTSANGFAGEVDECIGNLMSSWRFPVPKDKDNEATTAAFSITLQLVPD